VKDGKLLTRTSVFFSGGKPLGFSGCLCWDPENGRLICQLEKIGTAWVEDNQWKAGGHHLPTHSRKAGASKISRLDLIVQVAVAKFVSICNSMFFEDLPV
jgi:hypothetical protein